MFVRPGAIPHNPFHKRNLLPTIYNGFMIETLYKTHTPEKGKSECYVLVLTSRVSRGGKVYAFMEEHGNWNDDLQRFVYRVKSINAEEQLTYERAHSMYKSARGNLIGKGFVHSFGPDGARHEPHLNQVAEFEAAIA